MADDEVLDVRPRVRWPTVVAVVAAVALGVLAGFVLRGPGDSGPAAAPGTVTVTASAATPADEAADIDRELLLIISEAGAAPDGAERTEPFDTCQRPGDSMDESVNRVVNDLLARVPFRFPHPTRIVDGAGGLCRVELRGTDGSGTVLIVHVVAPLEETHLLERREDVGSATIHGVTTQYVRFSQGDGWIVTVGSTGSAGRAPDLGTLRPLAESRGLRW